MSRRGIWNVWVSMNCLMLSVSIKEAFLWTTSNR